MIECFFKDHAVTERLKRSVLGPHIDTFISVSADLGYSPSTIRTQLEILGSLTRWIQKKNVDIFHIDKKYHKSFSL